MEPRPREDYSLNLAAVVMTWLLTGAIVLTGVPEVFYSTPPGSDPSLALPVLGLLAFSLGFYLWPVALVLGLVSVFRSRRRRLWRSTSLVGLLVGAPVLSMFASGWGFGSGDDDEAPADHHLLRGLLVWGIAAVVAFAVTRLLPLRPRAAGRRPGWSRATSVVMTAAAAVLAADVVGVAYLEGRPGVYILNDTAEPVTLQICPKQECHGPTVRIAAGDTKHFRLGHGDELTPDSARITRNGTLLGCVLIDRFEDLNNAIYSVTDADLKTC